MLLRNTIVLGPVRPVLLHLHHQAAGARARVPELEALEDHVAGAEERDRGARVLQHGPVGVLGAEGGGSGKALVEAVGAGVDTVAKHTMQLLPPRARTLRGGVVERGPGLGRGARVAVVPSGRRRHPVLADLGLGLDRAQGGQEGGGGQRGGEETHGEVSAESRGVRSGRHHRW